MKNEVTTTEILDFLKENMVTKGEFIEFKKEMYEFRDSTNGELRMIRIELSDIKQLLELLEKRTFEDANAAATDFLELRKRVEQPEQRVNHLNTSS